MKRILLAFVLFLFSAPAWAQCNGVFPNNTLCGNISGASNIPKPVPNSALTGVPGGLSPQIQFNNSGNFGGFTMSGDCTINTTTGVIICTKTNGTALGPMATIPSNPTNFFVSTAGSDSNNCLSSGSPCLTIQHAVSLAQASYLAGSKIRINLTTGTFTSGAFISGTMLGNANGTFAAPMLEIVGVAGTIIDPSTTCGTTGTPITITNGAIVGIGTVKLQTTCSGGSDLFINNNGVGYLVDGNVNFGAANNALIFVGGGGSQFNANYLASFGFTISGGASFGFEVTTNGVIVTGIGITNTISGTPTFSTTFLSLIDGAFYNEGITSTWANPTNAIGRQCSIALNSHIDREQNSGQLPGSASLPCLVQGSSVYYQNNAGTASDLPCITSFAGCRVTTPAPSGLGGGGGAILLAGSNDHSGAVQIQLGTSAPSSGTVAISTHSILTGDFGGGGYCVVGPYNFDTNWPTNTVVQGFYVAGVLNFRWAGTMVSSTNYDMSYVCN